MKLEKEIRLGNVQKKPLVITLAGRQSLCMHSILHDYRLENTLEKNNSFSS